jgi:hypothetical protein
VNLEKDFKWIRTQGNNKFHCTRHKLFAFLNSRIIYIIISFIQLPELQNNSEIMKDTETAQNKVKSEGVLDNP